MAELYYFVEEILGNSTYISNPFVRILLRSIAISILGAIIMKMKSLMEWNFLHSIISQVKRAFLPSLAVVEIHSRLRSTGRPKMNRAFASLEAHLCELSTKGDITLQRQCVEVFEGPCDAYSYSGQEPKEVQPFRRLPVCGERFQITYEGNVIEIRLQMTLRDTGTESYVAYYYTLTHHNEHILRKFLESTEISCRLQQRGVRKIHQWKQAGSQVHEWKGVLFSGGRQFRTIFLRHSMEMKLEEDLKRFIRSESRYKQLGTSWNRGYLLHGPPGTGKSSLIKAFIELTGWPVYWIDLQLFDSREDFSDAFTNIPEQSILLFEEIDTQEIGNRTKEISVQVPNTLQENTTVVDGIQECQQNRTKSQLGQLLNILDGLLSGHGRIIIMTTNHLDELDPAFIRPGRIDMQILLDYADFDQMRRMVQFYFPQEDLSSLPVDDADFNQMEDWKVSPATIAGICLQNQDNFEEARNCLLKLRPN